MNEAAVSVNFRLFDSYGLERQITLRSADRAEAKLLLSESSTLIGEALKRGWTIKPQQPESAQKSNGHKPDGEYETFVADQLVITFDEHGKGFKVKGGKYRKHGVRVWPEVISVLGFDPDKLEPGIQPINLKVSVLMENGQPKKVVGMG